MALVSRDMVAIKMTPDQTAEAQRTVREWILFGSARLFNSDDNLLVFYVILCLEEDATYV